ncbi:MAG: TatD family hydrolase [Elusimicrobia bacterium]|nr:TatD family hydrolase [Elusimicrobiota bacterium]
MLEFFDTHAHLGEGVFEADRETVLERARAAGVINIAEIADAPAEWPGALALSRARPLQLRCALGLHPYYAREFSLALLDALAAKARLPEVAAVGEIGLDYVKTDAPKEIQVAAFRALLAGSLSWGKPAVIHCRGAYEDLRGVLGELCPHPPSEFRFWGVVHCFSGNADDALFLIQRGFALGVDGPVTYPKNDDLRAALREAGLERLVLETDSPYLPPQSSRGRRNEPAAIPEIAAKVAEVFGRSLEDVARETTANARALYRFPAAAPA